jgi:tetratricopeptide (TPR) repeat protein
LVFPGLSPKQEGLEVAGKDDRGGRRGTGGGRHGRPQDRGAPRERAGQRGRGAPPPGLPLRPSRPAAPKKPELPEERPRLPRDVYADLRSASRADQVEDVTKAFAAAGEALEEGDLRRARELLTWAKSVSSRSAVIREALGVVLYHAEDFSAAHAELGAYRRLSGRADQNHLLADCARAGGRLDRVAEYVEEMAQAGVEQERVVEGWIVLAASKADAGDVSGALAVLERAGLSPAAVQPWHPRLWYFAADLAERTGDREQARDYLEAIVAVDSEYLDAAARLEQLDS